MGDIKSYKDLIVWQKSMELAAECYKVADSLPNRETYLRSTQFLRAAISIPSNIAEGQKRASRKEYANFCSIASGSAAELETQLLIVQRQYSRVDLQLALGLVDEIQKMLYVLLKQLKTNP